MKKLGHTTTQSYWTKQLPQHAHTRGNLLGFSTGPIIGHNRRHNDTKQKRKGGTNRQLRINWVLIATSKITNTECWYCKLNRNSISTTNCQQIQAEVDKIQEPQSTQSTPQHTTESSAVTVYAKPTNTPPAESIGSNYEDIREPNSIP